MRYISDKFWKFQLSISSGTHLRALYEHAVGFGLCKISHVKMWHCRKSNIDYILKKYMVNK